MALRAVLFDRDDVLVEMDWKGINRDVFSTLPFSPQTLVERWARWSPGGSSLQRDTDAQSVSTFLRSLGSEIAEPEVRHELFQFDFTRFVRAFSDARPALTAARDRGLRIGVLSNNSILMSPRGLLSLVGLDELVDVALTAQLIGAAKPEPKAYRAAAEVLGVLPEECLFFDNNADWVGGARALGIPTYHVDRSRAEHDLSAGVVRDLSALTRILDATGG